MDGLSACDLHALLRWLKDGPPGALPIEQNGRSLGYLQAVTWEDAGDAGLLTRLARWHEAAFSWFPEPYPVTHATVRRWLVEQVLPVPGRVLFWVKDVRGEPAGHVGLSQPETGTSLALCDVLSGEAAAERLISAAVTSLTVWVREALGLDVHPQGQRRAA